MFNIIIFIVGHALGLLAWWVQNDIHLGLLWIILAWVSTRKD